MAGDFHEAFDVGSSDEHINSINADGVAFAAIQGLSAKLDERDDRIDEQRDRIEDLETDLAEKDQRIDDLEAENKELRERLSAIEETLATADSGGTSPASDDD
jgi:chromosome segregation ATPase